MGLYCYPTMTATIEFITTREAAQRLNMTHENLLQLVHRHPDLQPGRFGREYMWTRADLEKIEAFRARPRRGARRLTK
jgi:hypothetical protein